MDKSLSADVQAYFATVGPFTDLSSCGPRIRELPTKLDDLCRVVQGLVIHPFFVQLYGMNPVGIRSGDLEVRKASEMIQRLFEIDSRPLVEPRPPELRFVGNCRHFTVLLCAFLRAQGVPARARCGFGTYFNPLTFEDHWVCEVWDEMHQSWRLVDSQIDTAQRDYFQIPFDPLDMPRSQFHVAGHAWDQCRKGQADPMLFGILDLRGLWFVRGNLVRDLAALNKHELLPWDAWGLMIKQQDGDAAEMVLLDYVAELTQAVDERHTEILEVQNSEPGLRIPRVIVSFNLGGADVDLGPGIVTE